MQHTQINCAEECLRDTHNRGPNDQSRNVATRFFKSKSPGEHIFVSLCPTRFTSKHKKCFCCTATSQSLRLVVDGAQVKHGHEPVMLVT